MGWLSSPPRGCPAATLAIPGLLPSLWSPKAGWKSRQVGQRLGPALPQGSAPLLAPTIALGKLRPTAGQRQPGVPKEAMSKAEIAMVRAGSWERARGGGFIRCNRSARRRSLGGLLREEKAFRPVDLLLLPSGLRKASPVDLPLWPNSQQVSDLAGSYFATDRSQSPRGWCLFTNCPVFQSFPSLA